MKTIERLLRNALSTVDASVPEVRQRVYSAASLAVQKLPPQEREVKSRELVSAINAIESEIRSADSAKAGADEPETDFETPIENPASSVLKRGFFFPTTISNRQLNAFVLGLVILGIVALFLFFAYRSHEINAREAGSVTAVNDSPDLVEQPAITDSPPQLEGNENERTDQSEFASNIISIDFANDLDKVVDTVSGRMSKAGDLERFQSDGKFVISGKARIFAKDPVRINTDTIYLMKLVFDWNADHKPPSIVAGFATFDSEMKVEKDPPGTHRYFLNGGRLRPAELVREDGNYTLSAVITGTGNESHDTFRPGTAFAKPVLLIDTRSDENLLELVSLTVTAIE